MSIQQMMFVKSGTTMTTYTMISYGAISGLQGTDPPACSSTVSGFDSTLEPATGITPTTFNGNLITNLTMRVNYTYDGGLMACLVDSGNFKITIAGAGSSTFFSRMRIVKDSDSSTLVDLNTVDATFSSGTWTWSALDPFNTFANESSFTVYLYS